MKWRAEAAALAGAALLSACASTGPRDGTVKIGKPYQVGGRTYVPRDDRRYDATGIASWYGRDHHGKRTANGERYDMNAISAAHPTLPMPSYVEVTVMATGRRAIVRINDRGPFAAGRIIDLSRAAARKLGIEREGTARVRVRRASAEGRAMSAADERVAAPVPTLPTVPQSAPNYIQVAALGDPDVADALASRLAAIGPAGVIATDRFYRVRIGPLEGDALVSTLAEVRRRGYQDAHIITATP